MIRRDGSSVTSTCGEKKQKNWGNQGKQEEKKKARQTQLGVCAARTQGEEAWTGKQSEDEATRGKGRQRRWARCREKHQNN